MVQTEVLDPLACQTQFCMGQWKEQEKEEDRKRDGKIKSKNGQAWNEMRWGTTELGADLPAFRVLSIVFLFLSSETTGQILTNRIHHLCSVGSGKSQTECPLFQSRETRLAAGTMDLRVGIPCRHWTPMILFLTYHHQIVLQMTPLWQR